MKVDLVPGPMWSVGDYLAALGALQEGMKQLKPDGCDCSICGDSGHQAWECHHNPLVKMARADKADSEWRCYNCGEIFTDEATAHMHFGLNASEPPGCCADELITLLRWCEQKKHESVAARPNSNIFKAPLAATWDAIIGKITELRVAVSKPDGGFSTSKSE